MKPFELETVLKYRDRLKSIARNKLQEAQNVRDRVRDRLAAKESEYQELITNLNTLQAGGIDVLEHIRYENRIEFVSRDINSFKKQLEKKQELVIRERKHLIQKSKEHKALEKLKERQNADWKRWLDKKEAAMLDEIAVLHKNP